MNVYRLEYKSLSKGLVVWAGIVSAILVLFMAFYPSMKNEMMQQLVGAKLNAFPPAMMEALGLSSLSDLTNITFFFCYVIQYINIAAAVYAALLGSSALIKEESDGTIEYLYAQPVSRNTIVKQKMLANLTVYTLFVVSLGVVTTILFAILKPEDSDLLKLLTDVKMIFIGMFFVGLIFMALGFLISALLKSVKQASPFSLGVVFLTYIFGIFSVVIKKLDFLKYFSPIDYVKPEKLVRSGFDPAGVWIGLGLIVFSGILSFVLYHRKDLKI